MITKLDIMHIARKLRRGGAHPQDRALTHPHRDWIVALLVAGTVALVGMTTNAYLFQYYSSVDSRVVGTQPTTVQYGDETIMRILEVETTRRTRFEELQGLLPEASMTATGTASGTEAVQPNEGDEAFENPAMLE